MNPLRAWYVGLRRRQIYRRVLSASSRTVILRYHSIGEPAEVARYLDPSLSVRPERFRQQLRELAARFQFLTMDDVAAGHGPAPGRYGAVVTFDDGFRDNHDVALPILREEGVPATFYVTTAPLDGRRAFWISELWRLAPALPAGDLDLPPDAPARVPADPEGRYAFRRAMTRYLSGVTDAGREAVLDQLAARAGRARGEGLEGSFMTPEHLRALRAAGMLVGAHTRTHPHLNRLDARHHDDEVAGSRSDLEAALGERVAHFAYPNPSSGGAMSDGARAAVAAAGFASAVTSTPDPLERDTDRLRLPRVGVYVGGQEAVLFRLLGRARG